MRSNLNVVQRAVRKKKFETVPSRLLKSIPVPFSWTGIIAVLACPILLCTDIFTSGYTYLGIIYVLILVLLNNERRMLIALFSTMSALMLAIDLRFIYGQQGAEVATMDKMIALVIMPVLAYGLIRQRTQQVRIEKRKKLSSITIIPPLNERIALAGETRSVFHHICRSRGPMDDYTRELIWFVYMKSPKN